MLNTDAITKVSSATAQAVSELGKGNHERRAAAVERARRHVAEYERNVEYAVSQGEALIAGVKSKAVRPTFEDLSRWIEAVGEAEGRAAASLDARRGPYKRVLAFFSEKDRALFDDVRLLAERDLEAATRLCETLRDGRWALTAARAELVPQEEAVEIASAADLRRALIGR